MCDLHSKFEENRTKTAIAIVEDRYFGHTDAQTDRQTYIYTQASLLSVQCNALHWTDNKLYTFRLRDVGNIL